MDRCPEGASEKTTKTQGHEFSLRKNLFYSWRTWRLGG